MRNVRHRTSFYAPARRKRAKRISPLLGISVLVPVVIVLVAVVTFVLPRMQSHAAATINGNCSLLVPSNPLTAQGLATPYQLAATNAADGPCNEANAMQAAFVQASVIDPATGNISVYDPLVIDAGTQPAAQPVVPVLPAGAIVGIWFGFNGNALTLQDNNGSVQAGQCVNGTVGSPFGQVAYCNAPAFFQAANSAIQAGKLKPPPLGTAKDGMPCPTVRDYSVVDMDPSDNVTTTYLVTASGQTAQVTAANMTALQNAQVQVNGSDNRLLSAAIDGALGCTPWMAPDLANPGQMATALPLDELQAAAQQAAPRALVPNLDPMVLVNGQRNLRKLNAYRVGVDQPVVNDPAQSSTQTFCSFMRMIAPPRLSLDAALTIGQPSPDAAAANSLLTFLEQRFVASYGANGLNCQALLHLADPITVQTDANGVAIDGTINGVANGSMGGGTTTSPTCVVNGKTIAGCTGTTTINNITCTFMFDANTRQVNIVCPAGIAAGN